MKRGFFIIIFAMIASVPCFAGQPPGINLNPSGVSYIYPPLGSADWIMTQGPEVGQVLHDHDGDDYYAQDWAISCFSEGKEVYAGISGTLLLNPNGDGNQDYFGNTAIVHDSETGFAVRYAHLQEFNPLLHHGDHVVAGQYLGKVGHTGNCYPSQYCARLGGQGGHLHVVLYKNVWNATSRPVWRQGDFNSGGTTRRSTSFAARFKYTSGVQLARPQNSQTVFVIKNGRRYTVSWFVFNNQGWNFDHNRTVFNPVQVWADSQVYGYPEAGFHPPRDGTLVRGEQDQTVFLIQNGQKFAVSYTEFSCRGFRFEDVQVINQSEVNNYPPGANTPDLTGCSGGTTNPADNQAKQDMIQRSREDYRFGSPITESFGKDVNWDAWWELRWMEFNFTNGRKVTMVHATGKWDNSVRVTAFTDPDTGQWTGWQPVQ